MDSDFEVVHTMVDFYDGPRQGVANFRGIPHLYQSEYSETEENDWQDTFLLQPIDNDVFALVMESWAIWRRWETAELSGEAPVDTHPALPEDRARYEEIEELLHGRLEVDSGSAIRAVGVFRAREDPAWSGKGWSPLEAKWTKVVAS